ncbi:MAG: iron-containing alcohol dehydrogenase [Planctomycetota bacterium]|nr:MAG: iron-containing alcohol dehydrogenase [Planctomycetota bacterium]REJ92889.1 MAG: iron-containing alcohol dehydrogenase [Planctomycetota bacterium]
MNEFDFQPQTRIVFGSDRIDDLGTLTAELGAQRVLVVTDPGIVAAGHATRAVAALETQSIAVTLFEGVHENPTTDDVEAGLVFAQSWGPDLIVGLGGGSSMDCAKGINFLLSNGGRMQDYWGVGKAKHDMLPMIAVPTTAGTGSEAQSFALITDAETHVKMACGDRRAAFRVAILDPKLTLTQPARVTALTGIDAIAHALETYVTRLRNPASLAFSREAWRLLGESFARVLDDGANLEARSGMQLGACFAGLAIENSMLGAAHALANPLTANYGVVHGQAVGVMLPHVIRFNGDEFDPWYRELLEVTEGVNGCPAPDAGAAGLADYVTELTGAAGLQVRLSDLGVESDRLATLAAEAATQWTGTFNPRKVDAENLLAIYRTAF